jgi:hypothetical protein
VSSTTTTAVVEVCPWSMRVVGDRVVVRLFGERDPLSFARDGDAATALRAAFRDGLDRALLVACTIDPARRVVLAAQAVVPEGFREAPPPDAARYTEAFWAAQKPGPLVIEDTVRWVRVYGSPGGARVSFERFHSSAFIHARNAGARAMVDAARRSLAAAVPVRARTLVDRPVFMLSIDFVK